MVDNGSTDGAPDVIRKTFPETVLIENTHNAGFAAGNNAGIRKALDSEYILLLNNDTTVAPGLLDELVDVMESDPRIAVAGPVICYADAPETVWCAGLQIGAGSAFGRPVSYTTSILMYTGRPVAEVPAEPYEVDAVVGCAMLLRTRVLREIGLLDESLFMIHEDFEWSLRAHAAGYRCVMVPVVGVWHRVSASIRQQERGRRGNPVSVYYWYRNWLVVVRRYFGWKAMMAVALMYMFRLFPSVMMCALMRSELSVSAMTAHGLAVYDAVWGRMRRRFVR